MVQRTTGILSLYAKRKSSHENICSEWNYGYGKHIIFVWKRETVCFLFIVSNIDMVAQMLANHVLACVCICLFDGLWVYACNKWLLFIQNIRDASNKTQKAVCILTSWGAFDGISLKRSSTEAELSLIAWTENGIWWRMVRLEIINSRIFSSLWVDVKFKRMARLQMWLNHNKLLDFSADHSWRGVWTKDGYFIRTFEIDNIGLTSFSV